MKVSYDCNKLIEEVNEDIELYGKNEGCYLYYKKVQGHDFCTDYALEKDLEQDNKGIFKAKEGETRIKSTLEEALNIFMKQNSLF